MRVLGLQLAASVAAAALALMWSFDDAKAALLGGLVAFLPNACFAWAVARAKPDADQHAVWMAGRVLVQWAAKTVATAALLVATIVFVKPAAVAFVCGLAAALFAQLGAPLVTARTERSAAAGRA